MQFSDTTNKAGLIQDVDFLCGTNSASFPVVDKTRCINIAYHDVSRMIWDCSGDWEYDDSNKTDLPIATTLLVDAQQDYELPSTAQRVERMEVLDSGGDYQKLKPIDKSDVNVGLTEYQETDGLPRYYDLIGRSVFLYPAPASGSVTVSAGLKIHFDRDVTEFATSATTTVPGFATQFHRILSVATALDFERDPSQRAFLVQLKDRLDKGLKQFYGKRHREYRTRIKPSSFRNRRQYE